MLYGTIPIFGKISVTIFSPLFVTFTIPLVVAILLGLIVVIKKKVIKNLAKKDVLWILALGFFAALGSLFSFKGLSLGRASDAGFLLQLEIVFAAILAYIFLKEKLFTKQIIGLIFMIFGVYVFFFGEVFPLRIANILFLSASFVWGINDVIVRKNLKTLSPFYLAFGRYFFSSIIIFPFAASSFYENTKKVTIENALFLLLYAILIAGLILLLYHALKYVKTAEAIAFQLLAPILTAIISFFFLGERMEIARLVGGIVILVGLFLMIERKANIAHKLN